GLPVPHGQQRRLRAGGGEAHGGHDHGTVYRVARDRMRDEPDHLPHGVARHDVDRPGGVHAVPVGIPGARADLQSPGDVDGRPAHHQLSGPILRASGVAYDVRKDKPYLDYETYDFDVVVGEHGDVYDRYLVRLEECSQSNRILQQALDRLPDGPVNIADPRVILPPKSRAMNDMEAMIYHFKQVMEGVKAPVGETYVGIENPKGELGTYLVSDGTAKPVRWRIRPPSFINLAALP